MAEPIEISFPDGNNEKLTSTPTSEATADKSVAKMAQAALPPKTAEEIIPEKYTLDNYYQDDEIAKDVLRNKYLAPNETTPWELWKRIAKAIASTEAEENQKHWEDKFLSILEDFRFVPGGRIMHGAGRSDINTTLNNCYVVAIKEDSIHAIYQAVIDEALTYKFGGGCGHDLSLLRPSGSVIGGTGGESCGPIGFMDLFSINTNTIAQHGRRGANMQTLRVDHPDIEKFINIKNDLSRVRYSNISVLLTHDFMKAVEEDEDFDLVWDNIIYKTLKATDLWEQIITAAHSSAEPGLIFWDTMRDYHNGEYCSPLASTNPCAEQPLPDGGCCNLGSINLERFVDEDGTFVMDDFKSTVQIATRFLDNVIDYNVDRHALESQKENAINDRRIGLGILGLGDMLVRMSIRYDSDEALEIIDTVLEAMRDVAYATAVEIAVEKESFPNFDWDGYSQSKYIQQLPQELQDNISVSGIRNVTILTVPPTGSGAIVAQVTSGIEPIFATSYTRRVKENSSFGDSFREYTVYHPVIKNLFGTDKELPAHVVTSHNIDPYFRVKMQGVIQKYIDSSISSTVNLAEEVTVSTVGDIYLRAYHEGLKGITVYREGSREGILISDIKGEAQASEDATQIDVPGDPPTPVGVAPLADKSKKLHPRHRQEMTYGVTRRVRTGEGNLYITINEDEEGLCEVFTTIGKAGGLASTQAEAISRLISLALRSGVDAAEVVKQLKGISGPTPTWEAGRLILSTPDAIGQALDDYLKNRPWGTIQTGHPLKDANGTKLLNIADAPEHSAPATDQSEVTASKTMTTCPSCGGSVVHEGGCITCPSCGYTRC